MSPLRFSYPYIIAEKRAERESASLTGVASSNPIDPKVYAFVRDGSASSLLAIKIKEASQAILFSSNSKLLQQL
ncbi:hypothetical protein LPIBR_40185 [Lacticaseibacillus paracasei]|nr:hypothetical protein LPIBR_40185 [Lacticaseibacillus paracasei]